MVGAFPEKENLSWALKKKKKWPAKTVEIVGGGKSRAGV